MAGWNDVKIAKKYHSRNHIPDLRIRRLWLSMYNQGTKRWLRCKNTSYLQGKFSVNRV